MKLLSSKLLLAWGAIARCETFDYVIAGAGTCGLVLANRLSEDPNVRVAVIEVGDDVRDNPNVTAITGFGTALNTPIAWKYHTVPQTGAGNKSIAYSGGKAIGGTTTINGMTYIRGDKAEFDAWESFGNPGWSWDTLYPYFKKVEQFTPPTTAQTDVGASYDAKYHGDSGLLKTGFPFQLINGSFNHLVESTWENLGYSVNPDINSGDVHGFSVWPQTLDRDANIREDAARAFLHPVEHRPNLFIIQGTVKRIIWGNYSGDVTADGFEYLTPDYQTVTISASKEVILSAGALRTPLILELSGIGNPSILSEHDIATTVELPGVGENLQDQPNVFLVSSSKMNATGAMTPYATFVNAYDLFGNETASIAASTNASLSKWALTVSEASKGAVSPQVLERLYRIQHDLIFKENVTVAETLTGASGTSVFSSFWLLLPFSRGSVHLTQAEAINHPAIDPKFFLIDFDLSTQIGISRLSQKLWYTAPLDSLVLSSEAPNLPLNATDAQWISYFNTSFTTSNNHPVGTASMMSRELGGVVDPTLKVYGTKNVRVVDASVIPFQVSGHLTATLYAVAERTSEIIRDSWQ